MSPFVSFFGGFMTVIESKSNSKIKMLISLAYKKGRKENGMYLIEGLHMVTEAIAFKMPVVEVFVAESAESSVMPKLMGAMCDITTVKDSVFALVSKTENSQGVVAAVRLPENKPFYAGDMFLVLDRIQDPGNMGTIVRTAAATGFTDIVLIDCVDPFNPKAVRSSSSGVFFVRFHKMTEKDVLGLSASHNLISASAEGENVFQISEIPTRFGLVIGNEAGGVSLKIKEKSKLVALPMQGDIESLNAAVSASVLMYVLKNR